VTCQTDDDIENILRFAGEDNLTIGTDYGHTDQSAGERSEGKGDFCSNQRYL
jgi:hypothetical protein